MWILKFGHRLYWDYRAGNWILFQFFRTFFLKIIGFFWKNCFLLKHTLKILRPSARAPTSSSSEKIMETELLSWPSFRKKPSIRVACRRNSKRFKMRCKKGKIGNNSYQANFFYGYKILKFPWPLFFHLKWL